MLTAYYFITFVILSILIVIGAVLAHMSLRPAYRPPIRRHRTHLDDMLFATTDHILP